MESLIQMAREFRLDDGQATDPVGHGANAGIDEEEQVTCFWDPLNDERARELVPEWGVVPVSELWAVIVSVAQNLDRRGRPFEALALLSAACEVTTDWRAVSEMSCAAADVAVNVSEPLAGIAAAKVARRAAEELDDSELDPRWQLILGHALGDLGHVDDALGLYREVRGAYAERGMIVDVANVDLNVAIVLHGIGENDNALGLLTEAATVFAGVGEDHQLKACWLTMSPALRCLRRFDEALIVNLRLVELQRMANDPHLLAHALVNLGNIYDSIDDREEAKECYLEALSCYRQIGMVSDEAICLSSLGMFARGNRQHELAESLQLHAAGIFEDHPRPCDLAIVRYQLALTSLHLGKFAEAKRHAELATDVPGTDLDPGLVLSEALRCLGDVEGADRERWGFVERQDEVTVREEEEVMS
jgi:tetratricopeptide (TPR) repeat protein